MVPRPSSGPHLDDFTLIPSVKGDPAPPAALKYFPVVVVPPPAHRNFPVTVETNPPPPNSSQRAEPGPPSSCDQEQRLLFQTDLQSSAQACKDNGRMDERMNVFAHAPTCLLVWGGVSRSLLSLRVEPQQAELQLSPGLSVPADVFSFQP
ncbi:Hypothetical predicted protein [Xyrichtys novacula]|uniref:Uncharacterized protein n=1 Tax=Xyrichtys novacula TaxID=13765 RepID=A0AAV1F4T1_XYRNO|nr:Hypothetical predicted protein [Xyrichtys novacula]